MKSDRFSIFLLLLLFTLFPVSHSVWAATLEGTVLDPGGKVVPAARVSLLRSLIAIGEQQADARGVYRFNSIEAGTYQILASSPGLSSTSIEVVLSDDKTKKQDIPLKVSAMASQVVVSASLGGALIPQIGSSVSIIDRQEIEDRAAENVVEIVRGVPGVEINQTARRGGMTSVFIRGGESNSNAILLDGIPMNQFGGEFYLESLPSDGIDRVEITRGPESALYGSNAMTGVINLISQKGEGAPRFTALAEGGSYDTRHFATGGNGLNRGFSWSYNLSRIDSDGANINDNYRSQSALLGIGFSQNKRQFRFNFFGNADDAGDPGAYGSDPDKFFWGLNLTNRVKQNLFGYKVNHNEQLSSRIRQVTTVSLSTNDYRYIYPGGASFIENLRGVANTRSEIRVSDKDALAVGFEFNREQTKDNFYLTDNNSSPFLLQRTGLAYFAENRWSPSSRIHTTIGIRVDNLRTHSLPAGYYGSRPFIPADSLTKVNPRLSLAYIAHEGGSSGKFGMTRFHGSFGTGIRPPSGYELGDTNNPELKPEKSVSFDAGVEQLFCSSRAAIDVSYFQNRYRDLIVDLGGSMANLSSFSSANLANSRARGMELSFRLHPMQSLEMSGQYTFLDSAILALDGASTVDKPFTVGQQLLRRPRNSASYNITWHHRRLMLNTNAYFRGDELEVEPNMGVYACTIGFPCLFTNPGHIKANAGFSYSLQHGVEIYGRISNLLNRKYEETLGYPSLRLNFMAGMRFRFSAE
jgi:outer membrane receptor protein involved in Fe transport